MSVYGDVILGTILLLAAPCALAQGVASPSNAPMRIRVGGIVQQAKVVHEVAPVYPSEAKEKHIEGTVVLHAVIDRDGSVIQSNVLSGDPLLAQAAQDAVRQWTYMPTRLNHEPVQVDTTISVVFTLDGRSLNNSSGGPSAPQISVPAAGVNALPFSGIPLDDIPSTAPPYSDSADGIRLQMGATLKAWRAEGKQKFAAQLDSFAMAEPKIWLEKAFGKITGASLVPEYQASLEKFKSHISWVSGNWSNAPDAALAVEVSQLPSPPVSAEEEAMLPKPDAAVRIENFRFTIKADDKVVESWVFSFVYLDGRFHIVGGTYPFWQEILQWQRVSVPEQLEGVAYKSPDGSLVRIYVSPQMQAMRIEKRVEPVYPEAAREAGIQGAVVFHAIIATDGTVKVLTREVGDPILAEAAEKAIRQWQYDEAIYIDPSGNRAQLAEVDTSIAVEFELPR